MAETLLAPVFSPHEQEKFSSPASYAVRFDLFPAEVSFTGPADPTTGAATAVMTMPKCRVLIGEADMYVFIDGPRGPVLVFYDLVSDTPDAVTGTNVLGDLQTGFTITPSSPELTGIATVTARPTNGCGCGSRLRGFRPFGVLRYIPSRG